ncbi:MAG TPA: hypothetical protein VEA69_25805, partial [Tepidisphaeraceae bacterium]|nr:hypothetical protein [Tepidisphaeraceae bacterium]
MPDHRPVRPTEADGANPPPATGAAAYTSAMIMPLPALPPVVVTAGRAARTYRYRFAADIPDAAALRDIGDRLSHVLTVADRPDVAIPIGVRITARGPRGADVTIEGTAPEDDPVYLYGIRRAPLLIERAIGRVESIEGHARAEWHAFLHAPVADGSDEG